MRRALIIIVSLFLLIGCGQRSGTEITTMPGGNLPKDFLEMKDRMTGEVIYLEQEPVLDQTSIKSASVFHDEFSPNTGYNVTVEFDEAGAREFGRLTESSIGKRIAIVYDGQVMTAPFVNEKIPGGRAVVSNGNLSKEEAEKIAAALNTGTAKDSKLGFYRVLEQEY